MKHILKYSPGDIDFINKIKHTVENIERNQDIQDVLFLREDFLKLARFFLKEHGIHDNRH